MIEELDFDFDLEWLIDDLSFLPKPHEYHNQISLKNTKPDLNDWYQGCGSLKYTFGSDFDGNLTEKEQTLNQSDFKYYNEKLEGSYLLNVCLQIESMFDIGRARVMFLPHKKVMSYHSDTQKRIHIPLVTNENCRLVIEDTAHYLPAGKAYLADTTKQHTAFNANHNFMRIHLLFDVNK